MKNLSSFEAKIQIHFRNQSLLQNVFIHRSYLNENKNAGLQSNEKLEFLGDSVLSLITSMYLYKQYQQLKEGEYTEIKAAIVRTESLADASKTLKLGDYLYLSKGQDQEEGRSNKNILADCFEALIAAIFIDQGFDKAYLFVTKYLFKDKLDFIVKHQLYLSPKSRLQEFTQAKYRSTPQYEVIEEKGPEHLRTYKVTVIISGKRQGIGVGKTKKEAEEMAAKGALEKIT